MDPSAGMNQNSEYFKKKKKFTVKNNYVSILNSDIFAHTFTLKHGSCKTGHPVVQKCSAVRTVLGPFKKHFL